MLASGQSGVLLGVRSPPVLELDVELEVVCPASARRDEDGLSSRSMCEHALTVKSIEIMEADRK